MSLLPPNPSNSRRYQEALQSLYREDVAILPFDKGISMIVPDRAIYLQNAQDLLGYSSNYIHLSSDPEKALLLPSTFA